MSDVGPTVRFLSNGSRLHLQHGPIDLIIGADGERFQAFVTAQEYFENVLQSLVDELADLRAPYTSDSAKPKGPIACHMHRSVAPFSETFVTRMICVAGSVADKVLEKMTSSCKLDRAYVNNGGDIALHLKDGQTFSMAISDHAGRHLGALRVSHQDGVGGVATSGRHGRSMSLGIADAVTVLAKDAATADVAATLIANAVDLPGHSMISRKAACELDPSSDLGHSQVVTDCQPLNDVEVDIALERGLEKAKDFLSRGLIIDAALFLQEGSRILGQGFVAADLTERTQLYA